MNRASFLSVLFWISIGCAGTYYKGYEGPELPREELSFVRAANAPVGSVTKLSTLLVNPLTKKSVLSGRSMDQGWKWLMVNPSATCITVRTVAMNCSTLLALGGGVCAPNLSTQNDQTLCFHTEARV